MDLVRTMKKKAWADNKKQREMEEGSLKWLQGQRVPIPMVDERVNVILCFSSPKRLEGEEDKDSIV